jgi:23S rRNA maturation-related 3'-5' exoribonuclease YhaM
MASGRDMLRATQNEREANQMNPSEWQMAETAEPVTGKLTETEAETLAVMLDHASRKMARVKARIPGSGEYDYVWENPYEAVHDMCEGFYAIVPGEYGIYL